VIPQKRKTPEKPGSARAVGETRTPTALLPPEPETGAGDLTYRSSWVILWNTVARRIHTHAPVVVAPLVLASTIRAGAILGLDMYGGSPYAIK
jgi:hypothetical protein